MELRSWGVCGVGGRSDVDGFGVGKLLLHEVCCCWFIVQVPPKVRCPLAPMGMGERGAQVLLA